MEIRLISHASVIIRTSDIQIWSDPWLFGKVFNDSWTLFPEPVFDDNLLDDISYVWISHEHPDHFHPPTLRKLPDEFKNRVTILFQENNSEKIFNSLRLLGFKKFIALPHRKIIRLSEDTEVYCYHVGSLDSVLGIKNHKKIIVNVNDCGLLSKDCSKICADFGSPDVVLNQFSKAGYCGYENHSLHMPIMAENHRKRVVRHHLELGAKITIPFASFIYFSNKDNYYMNAYANRPKDIFNYFAKKKLSLVVLFPGDVFNLELPYSSEKSLSKYSEEYSKFSSLSIDSGIHASPEELVQSFNRFSLELQDRFSKLVLFFLKPVVVYLPDLDRAYRFGFFEGKIEELKKGTLPHLSMNSQPLYFLFSFPYGAQTLGVSARYVIHRNFRNWKFHRIIFSMNNAEIYLRPKYFFRPSNLKYFYSRLKSGGLNQLWNRLNRMN